MRVQFCKPSERARRRRTRSVEQRGWTPLEIVGWIRPPAYDLSSHHLVWAIRNRSEGHEGANYQTRVLGRQGILAATLVCDSAQVNALVPTANGLLSGLSFTPGNTYAEWRSGDKMAAYGLTGLITGGGLLAAAKTGLLSKLGVIIAKAGKAIVVAVVALAAAIWKAVTGIWKAVTGRGKERGAP